MRPADPRVKIIGKHHPHRGEYGRFTGDVIRLATGDRMALVKLESCRHGTEGCYVSPGDVRQVDEEDQYV